MRSPLVTLAAAVLLVAVAASCTLGDLPSRALSTSSGHRPAPATPTPAPAAGPPLATFTVDQGAAVAMAGHVPLDEQVGLARYKQAFDLCATGPVPMDLASSRTVSSTDARFTSSAPDPDHRTASSFSFALHYPTAEAASAAWASRLPRWRTCDADVPDASGHGRSHVVGSPLSVAAPLVDGFAMSEESRFDTGEAKHIAEAGARLANLQVGCEAYGVDAAAARALVGTCMARLASAARVSSRPSPVDDGRQPDQIGVVTLVGRSALAGYDLIAGPGYTTVCVLRPDTTTYRSSAPSFQIGWTTAGDTMRDRSTIDVLAVPFPTVAAASARVTVDAVSARSCVGRYASSDPTFVPTWATAATALSPGLGEGGVAVAWEERYVSGTRFHVEGVTRSGSVVLYAAAEADSAAQAQERAVLALTTAVHHLVSG